MQRLVNLVGLDRLLEHEDLVAKNGPSKVWEHTMKKEVVIFFRARSCTCLGLAFDHDDGGAQAAEG